MPTVRLNFRVDSVVNERLREAARIKHLSVTDFVIQAATDSAEEVLFSQTVVSADFFDQLLDILDSPTELMPELAKIVQRPRRFVRK